MYMNAGKAAYSVSTGFTRLHEVKFSCSYNKRTNSGYSLSYRATDILHERHYIRLIEVATCINSNR